MKHFITMLIIILSLPLVCVYAAPTQTETDAAVAYFNSHEQSQPQGGERYTQVETSEVSGITYETHEYLGPDGVGYVQYAMYTDEDGTYRMCRHTGSESRCASPNTWELVTQEDLP